MADQDFFDLFLLKKNGEILVFPGQGSWICPDGHKPQVLVGFEGKLMPLGLTAHVNLPPQSRRGFYSLSDRATADILRSYGALIAVPHSESWSVTEVTDVKPEVMEFGNHHAILDPKIRYEDLQLNPFTGMLSLLPFVLNPEETPPPDLAWIFFYEENLPAYLLWIQSSIRFKTTGIYGCDAHQNVYPGSLADGERGDSYRRMLRWVTNWIFLGSDPGIPQRDAFLQGLKEGSSATVFEVLGTPEHFQIRYDPDTRLLSLSFPKQAYPFGKVKTRVHIRGFSQSGALILALKDERERLTLPDHPALFQVTIEANLEHLRGFLGKKSELISRYYPWIVFQPWRKEENYSFPPSRK